MYGSWSAATVRTVTSFGMNLRSCRRSQENTEKTPLPQVQPALSFAFSNLLPGADDGVSVELLGG